MCRLIKPPVLEIYKLNLQVLLQLVDQKRFSLPCTPLGEVKFSSVYQEIEAVIFPKLKVSCALKLFDSGGFGDYTCQSLIRLNYRVRAEEAAGGDSNSTCSGEDAEQTEDCRSLYTRIVTAEIHRCLLCYGPAACLRLQLICNNPIRNCDSSKGRLSGTGSRARKPWKKNLSHPS